MERGICPIAVRYFVINVLFLTSKTVVHQHSTRVQILPQLYIGTILGHVTSSVT